MGRRAVPSVHRDLDLSGVFLTPEEVPKPWDPAALFGDTADRPLEVEIGSGKGLFLRRASVAKPTHNFFGIEIAYKYAKHCAACLTRDGQANVRVLAGDAAPLFREIFPDGSLTAVHIYFPDPWWKARHHKRRLITNEDFLRDVARVLKGGGELHFWTDVRDYFEAAILGIRGDAAARRAAAGSARIRCPSLPPRTTWTSTRISSGAPG